MAYEKLEVKQIFDSYEEKLTKAYDSLVHEFNEVKAGRANPHLVEKILVDYYGVPTPINQIGNISVPEARVLVISVWDKTALPLVEKAILVANIGLTPNNDGKVIRLIFPELTEERRKGLVKDIKSISENTKIALRNVRRDINESIKKLKKDSIISEDEAKGYEEDVDKLLAKKIEAVDSLFKEKEKEILSV